MKVKAITFAKHNWQELSFILSICVLLVPFSSFLLSTSALDFWDFSLLFYTVPVLAGLVSQLFRPSLIVSVCLSILLSLASFVFLVLSIGYLADSASNAMAGVPFILWAVLLLLAAITLPFKDQQPNMLRR